VFSAINYWGTSMSIKRMKITAASALVLCLVNFLQACGGGGDGDSSPPPPPPQLWSQQAYLKAPNAGASDYFGASIAASGDTVVVGAPYEASNQTIITNGTTASADNTAYAAGAAYVFTRSGTTWTQQAYLKAPNAEMGDELFGNSVAVSGDTVVVSARGEDSNQTIITNGTSASADNSAPSAGAAYVFTRSGTIWSQQAYLKAPNAGAYDWFGYSVAVSGDTVVVGAFSEASNQIIITNGATASADNSAINAGAAYVFTRSGSTWTHQAYLKAPNTGADDKFGNSVAVSGDTVVVGALGEDSSQTSITNSSSASADNSVPSAGAAYVFTRSGTTWTQQAYLKASNAGEGDVFGTSVAVSGDTVVVGAWREASNQTTITNGGGASANDYATAAGAAYIFTRSVSTWSQQAYLKAPNAKAYDQFGISVAVSGDTVVVGAINEASNQTTITNGTTASLDSSAASTGAVYVFTRSGSTWAQQAYLKAPNADMYDKFGTSVAVSGDTVVVGTPYEASNQITITNGTSASANNDAITAGAAYVFKYN
jgi:hypothetical protein